MYVFVYAVHLYVYTHIQRTHTSNLHIVVGRIMTWPHKFLAAGIHAPFLSYSKAILSVAGKGFKDVINVPSRKIIQMYLTFT